MGKPRILTFLEEILEDEDDVQDIIEDIIDKLLEQCKKETIMYFISINEDNSSISKGVKV